MKAGKIPVVRVQRGGAVGSVEDFEDKFERSRERKRMPVEPAPKLKPLTNPTMEERLAQHGIEKS